MEFKRNLVTEIKKKIYCYPGNVTPIERKHLPSIIITFFSKLLRNYFT